jgi:hypothetical protein
MAPPARRNFLAGKGIGGSAEVQRVRPDECSLELTSFHEYNRCGDIPQMLILRQR